MSEPRNLRPPKHIPGKPAWIRAAAERMIRTEFNDAFLVEEIGDVIAKHWPGRRAMKARRDMTK